MGSTLGAKVNENRNMTNKKCEKEKKCSKNEIEWENLSAEMLTKEDGMGTPTVEKIQERFIFQWRRKREMQDSSKKKKGTSG